MRVTCGSCAHRAEIAAASDVWVCNCHAGQSSDPECTCSARNEAPGTEDNPPDRSGDIAALEAQLLQLRGAARPEGAATHE
jgi:hypothetical protein